MVGYDVVEEQRSFKQDGITGTVSRYTKESLKMPCYVVKPPFRAYKIQVLRSMYLRNDNSNELDDSISIYFEQDGKTVGLGRIYPRQVNAFLKLFNGNEIVGYYNDGTELKGEYLYVLGGN